MERNSSLEKEKKHITNFLPKALIEEINKTYDDKNLNKSSFSLKEKELNDKPKQNLNNPINGNHIGFSLYNKNMNLLNGSFQNIDISNILYNQLNMNSINSESFMNNQNKIKMNNYMSKPLYNNIDINLKQFLLETNKINSLKNGINGLNGNININNINGNGMNHRINNHLFKNDNSFINGKNGCKIDCFNNCININNTNFNLANMINKNTIYDNYNQIQSYNSISDNKINNSNNINLISPSENNYNNNENFQISNLNGINTINNINNINNNFILNNNIKFNNQNFNIINNNKLSNSFTANNINNLYNKLNINKCISFNNKNINQINNINNININNFQNSNCNNNENIINGKMEIETEKNVSEIDIMDTEIEEIFSEIYNLNSDKSQILYLIKKKGPDFFIKLIKTHKGSKYLQKILSNNKLKEYETNYVTEIICKNFYSIICDYYGNYFLQKFFKFCSTKNRLNIYKLIKPNFKHIANDICGNHSLQCLILLQNSKEERKIIKDCIINDLSFLCFNQKSSHVIQKVIKAIKEKDRGYLNNYILNHLIELCIDANGICIIKEFMNNIKNSYFILFIINSFENNLEIVVCDQYGNFGIQEAIKLFRYIKCIKIIDKIINNLLFYSTKKYSSNVIVFLLNYLKCKNFSKLLQVINTIFNDNIFCNNNNEANCKKDKMKKKNSIYQKFISNQYAIYIIFTIIQILNEVDQNYFKKIVDNKKDVVNINEYEDSDDKEDEKNSEESKNYNKEESNNINIDNINYVNNCNIIPFEDYEKYKKGILLYIENNTQNKYKKKLLNLMKLNKIENNFITLKKIEQ